MGCGGAIGDNGQNLVKNDFFAFDTDSDNPNLDYHIKIETSSFLQEPYIFFGEPFYAIYSERPPHNYYHRYVIFKTFPGREIKVMKLDPNYYADREVQERIQEIPINESIPLKRLKKDIEIHRVSIGNPSFCSTIYNYIQIKLNENV